MPKNNTTKILANRLEELTEKKRDEDRTLSNVKQSKAIGIQYQTFRKYLEDNAECKIANLLKIARYYNVSTDYLIDDNIDDPSPNTFTRQAHEYTGLTGKAVKALHNYTHNNDDQCIMLEEWKKDNQAVTSKLFELHLIQDIACAAFALKQSSDLLINSDMDYSHFTETENECDLCKLHLFETLSKIINAFDSRVTQKDNYDKLKQKHQQKIYDGMKKLASLDYDEIKKKIDQHKR